MKLYEVIAQFAKAGAPSFRTPGYEGYLAEAKDYFNIRSRVATNPKEITDLSVIDDETIRIIFRSQDELNLSQVSRSLRVFSMYLINEEHSLNFSGLISGKRLFRMQASEFPHKEAEKIETDGVKLDSDALMHEPDVNKLDMVQKVCLLLKEVEKAPENIRDVKKIDTILNDFLKRREK